MRHLRRKIGRYIHRVKRLGQIWVYDFSKRLEQPSNDEIYTHSVVLFSIRSATQCYQEI